MRIDKVRNLIFLTLCVFQITACNAVLNDPASTSISEAVTPQDTQEFLKTEASEVMIPTEPSQPAPTQEPPPPTTIFLFTGVIVPARCVQDAIDQRGSADYIFDEVREMIQAADVAVGTLNATISDFPPHTGCISTYVLVGGAQNADAIAAAGFDVMSVATNHIKNCGLTSCGDKAFFDTMDNLERVGILPVGAGVNLAEAIQPVVVEVNGIRFGILSLGQKEELAFAGEDTPGIGILTDESLREQIEVTQEISDVVIAMPHWGPEDSAMPNWDQLRLARVAVEAGADLVVGNHTHVVQGFQYIDDVPVFYGLGNFVFDQIWARDHQQGVILLVKFEGTELVNYQMIPTIVDQDGTVHFADELEAQEVLERIQQVSDDIPVLP